MNNLIFLILRISLFSGFFLRNLTCTTLSIIVHCFKQQLQAILPILHSSNDVSSCTRFCEVQETCCYCVELRQFFIRKIVLCHYRIRLLNSSIRCFLPCSQSHVRHFRISSLINNLGCRMIGNRQMHHILHHLVEKFGTFSLCVIISTTLSINISYLLVVSTF